MTKDNIILAAWLAYVAVAFVVFGAFVTTFMAKGPAVLLVGMFVATFWPASGLIWLGARLA